MRKLHIRSDLIALYFFASTLSTLTLAASEKGEFVIYGVGGYSCGKFTNAANEGNTRGLWTNWNKYSSYTQGYITAANKLYDDTKDIGGSTDMEGIMASVENYCRSNPLKDFHDALNYTLHELYPSRTKK